MKFNLIIFLATCLSCWLTPAYSTGPLGAKIAAGVNGAALLGSSALAIKGKMLKGVETLLAAKRGIMHNVGTVMADAVKLHPEKITMEKPTDVIYEHAKPSTHLRTPIIDITHLRPFDILTLEDLPIENAVRLVPLDRISMELRTTEEKPLEIRHIRPIYTILAELKKKKLHGLFNMIHSAVVNKKMAVAKLMKDLQHST